ncbi:MAG: hypothetical protein Q8O14_00930 [bacterium]|nr:hypothetical protein [bacterium]
MTNAAIDPFGPLDPAGSETPKTRRPRSKPRILLINRSKVRELAAKAGFTQVSEYAFQALASELEAHLQNRLDLIRATGEKRPRLTPVLARYMVRSTSQEKRP